MLSSLSSIIHRPQPLFFFAKKQFCIAKEHSSTFSDCNLFMERRRMMISNRTFAFCSLAALILAERSQAFLTPSVPAAGAGASAAASSVFVLHQSSQMTDSGSDASSAAKFSGAGASLVDMNRYNLPLDQIAQEWTANVVPQSSLREEGIYLGAKSSKDIMVDTVKVSFRRRIGEGMGVELLELAGGRQDGLGITVVNGIVKGGAADGKYVMIGDSIVAVGVLQTERSTDGGTGGSMSDLQVSTNIDTECFSYDKMVEAIGSLPPAESDDEFIILTLKRLRRKPKVSIRLQYPPEQNEPDTTLELFAGENLRRAMLTRGIKLNDKLSLRFDSGGTGDCGADGTCATCVVGIVKGDELISPQGTQESQILKKNPRWRMACKAIVGYGLQEGEMTIRVNPRQW